MPSSEFEWRAFQGQGVTFTVTLAASFVGTETLSAAIYGGDSAAAVLTITPTWTAGQTANAYTQADCALTGAQLAALYPGSYSVLVSVAGGLAALAKGDLEVYPAPGGTALPYYRTLASPAFAQSFLPGLTREQMDALPLALVAATRAVEAYVGRPLVLDNYDHIIRPNNTRRLRLRSRPIVEVSRVKANAQPGVILTSSLGTGSSATVRIVPSAPNSLQIASLVFATVTSGVATSQTLTMSTYNTFADLSTAINALGNGWGSRTQTSTSGLAVTEAYGTPGVHGVLYENPYIKTHVDWLGWHWNDPGQGFIEVNEPISGGFLVPNQRLEHQDYRDWGVRVTYRAGYATAAADIALGYYPVPEDLAVACVMTANSIMESAPATGPIKSQSVKDRSYTLKDSHNAIPDAAKTLLMKYQSVVF
jgi:hypothetical protein